MADEADDLDYSEGNVGLAQAQGVRKNISLKLKGKGRGRGRRGGKVRRGSSKKVTEDEAEEPAEEPDEISAEKKSVDTSLDDVISKLETPAFSPMDRAFPEPLHQNKKLRWDHKVNLIGEKVIDPLIHCCEKCSLPILNYGRLIPCKHVFCYDCAKKADKLCPKCEEKTQRIEPNSLGTVFMCTFGGTRHSPGSCGRTYLSQRDLQAHFNHRHMKPSSSTASVVSVATVSTAPSPGVQSHMPVSRDPRDPRGHLQVDVSHQTILVGHMQHPSQDHREPVDHSRNSSISMGSPAGQSRQYPHSPASYPSTIPVSSARPNLITVPIQDDGVAHATGAAAHMHPQTHVPTYAPNTAAAAAPHPIPAIQHPGTAYTPHAYPHPTPSSGYSQAPPITTPTFSQPPPPVHHQPPLHQPGGTTGGPIYSTPPPPVHHQPPATYTPPRAPAPRPPMHPPPPPQHFHEEGTAAYMPQWGGPGSTVPPPPARASLPPRPLAAPPPSAPNPNVGLLQPRGPADASYRQPYYQ